MDGKDVPQLKRKELSRAAQARSGTSSRTARCSTRMTCSRTSGSASPTRTKFKDQEYCRERVAQCLKLVNLQPDGGEKFPAQLSGGMRKRVGIARAIAGQPKYLLYDEPTSGLDPVNADIIDELVKRLDHGAGVTSVMVTHDVRGAFRVADRLALLSEGKIVMQGTPQEFLASDRPRGEGVPRARLRQHSIRRLSHGPALSEGSRGRHHRARRAAVCSSPARCGSGARRSGRPRGPRTSGSPMPAAQVGHRGAGLGRAVGQGRERSSFKGPGRVHVTITVPPDARAPRSTPSAAIVTGIFASDATLALNPGSESRRRCPRGR